MAVSLTPEQEQRIQAIIHRGAYESANDVIEAGLIALEQCGRRDFEGNDTELWPEELIDTAQDIYTLEDGQPVNVATSIP